MIKIYCCSSIEEIITNSFLTCSWHRFLFTVSRSAPANSAIMSARSHWAATWSPAVGNHLHRIRSEFSSGAHRPMVDRFGNIESGRGVDAKMARWRMCVFLCMHGGKRMLVWVWSVEVYVERENINMLEDCFFWVFFCFFFFLSSRLSLLSHLHYTPISLGWIKSAIKTSIHVSVKDMRHNKAHTQWGVSYPELDFITSIFVLPVFLLCTYLDVHVCVLMHASMCLCM